MNQKMTVGKAFIYVVKVFIGVISSMLLFFGLGPLIASDILGFKGFKKKKNLKKS